MQDQNKEVRFVDTTLRDGPMSLWATRMTTSMMLPVAERLDEAGFEAIEIIASAFFKKCVRDLREDPWQRLDLVAQLIRKTPLRAIRGRYMTAFQITPRALEDLFVEPAHRGNGTGLALLRRLAQRAVAENCSRIDWWVLNWNEPSIAFYERIGSTRMTDWHVRQLEGPALIALAEGARNG